MKNQNWLANLTEETYNKIHDELFDKLYTALYQGAYTSIAPGFRDNTYENVYGKAFSQLYNESHDMSYYTFCEELYSKIYIEYGRETFNRAMENYKHDMTKYGGIW